MRRAKLEELIPKDARLDFVTRGWTGRPLLNRLPPYLMAVSVGGSMGWLLVEPRSEWPRVLLVYLPMFVIGLLLLIPRHLISRPCLICQAPDRLFIVRTNGFGWPSRLIETAGSTELAPLYRKGDKFLTEFGSTRVWASLRRRDTLRVLHSPTH